MRNMISAALFAATAIASPALAQNAAPFTGPHIEAIVGYDRLNAPNDFDNKKDGVVYGVAGGYDFQAGGVILGLEGEATDSSIKLRGYNTDVAGDQTRVSVGRDLYAGARVGFAAGPSTLIYAKGGYTNLRIKARYDSPTTSFRDSSTLDGYRLGAGIEQKFALFGPSGFAKLEYRYSNYQKVNEAGPDEDIDLDRHQVVVGVGVRF